MKYLYFLITYLSISSASPSLGANSRDHRRIFGGDEANIKDFPYIGSLLLERKHHCGVVLIRNDTVVTAAHCVKYYLTSEFSVRLGSSRWRSGGQEICVKQVTIHPEYNPVSIDYDMAVIKLNESVNVANAVPINLAKQGSPTGTLGVVSGWGRTETVAVSEILRKVEVPVYNQTQCRDAYGGNTITNRMICAGYKEGGKGFCNRDSGGPYVINDKLVGIVSFYSVDCAHPEYPGVYASVPALYDWIERYA